MWGRYNFIWYLPSEKMNGKYDFYLFCVNPILLLMLQLRFPQSPLWDPASAKNGAKPSIRFAYSPTCVLLWSLLMDKILHQLGDIKNTRSIRTSYICIFPHNQIWISTWFSGQYAVHGLFGAASTWILFDPSSNSANRHISGVSLLLVAFLNTQQIIKVPMVNSNP